MIKRKFLALAAGTLLVAAAPAFADGGGWKNGHRGHGYAHGYWKHKHHRPHRVVVVPAPRVYYAPPAPVVYVPPRPVLVYPQPVYVQPRPTIVFRDRGFSLAVGF
jgi:hypothetical protein